MVGIFTAVRPTVRIIIKESAQKNSFRSDWGLFFKSGVGSVNGGFHTREGEQKNISKKPVDKSVLSESSVDGIINY